jgi:hypothetical protein
MRRSTRCQTKRNQQRGRGEVNELAFDALQVSTLLQATGVSLVTAAGGGVPQDIPRCRSS